MVANSEETVGIDEKTAAFIEAMNDLKKKERKPLKVLAVEIGITEDTNNMIRAGRRKAQDEEIQSLVKKYPGIIKDYPILSNKSLSDKVEEPMILYSDGNAWRELSETQKKLLERIEKENETLKEENQKLKSENKALKEIIIDRTKPT